MYMAPVCSEVPLLIQVCKLNSLWYVRGRPSTDVIKASRTSSFRDSFDVIGVWFHRWTGLLAFA